jgi:ERCC4-type nuclease
MLIDARERYPYRFAGREVGTDRAVLPAGDYAVSSPDGLIATVERKTFENFSASLLDGTLAFQMGRLGEVSLAAVVVEGRYSDLFTSQHVFRSVPGRRARPPPGPLSRDPGGVRRFAQVRRGMDLPVPRRGAD